jgi:hypothetical protein
MSLHIPNYTCLAVKKEYAVPIERKSGWAPQSNKTKDIQVKKNVFKDNNKLYSLLVVTRKFESLYKEMSDVCTGIVQWIQH